MDKCSIYCLIHLRRIYGTSFFRNRNILGIKTDKEVYYIKPPFFKQKDYCFINVSTGATVVDSNFERGLFKVASSSVYKDVGKEPSVEDWERFLADAQKYKVNKENVK